jgi:hypothetical protein
MSLIFFANQVRTIHKYKNVKKKMPIPAAARSKAWVCGRSLAGIVGSNLAGVMDVCFECCVLSGRGLRDGLITRPDVWCV